MKKKLLSLAMALALCLSLVPPASAASSVSNMAGVNLNAGERRIYNELEKVVLDVYAGKRSDTQTTVTFGERELGWSAQELGFTALDTNNQSVLQAVMDKLNASLFHIYIALEYNHPYEMFFDSGGQMRYEFYWQNIGSELWLTDLTFSLLVSPDYQGSSDTTVDPYKRAKVTGGEELARRIVAENAGKSNYEKLEAYRDAICRLTSYDEERASLADTDAYVFGHPSQAASVFDGDANTLTICVGYARAFKYLCDLSDFDGDVCCYLASGNLDMGSLGGGGHTWNVVRMEDGKYYLTDITASNSGIYGENHPLLACANEPMENYNYQTALYTYADYNYGLYTDGWLPALSDTPYEPGHAVTTPTTPTNPTVPTGPVGPTNPVIPSNTVSATPTASTVLVNGKQTAFDAYNIDGANYFKLRDLAFVLNGTAKQFQVGWDSASRTITLTSGSAYTANGSEMSAGASGNQSAAPSSSKLLVDGTEVSLTAYNIGGNNYFKLRDIGKLFDFGIGWDNNTKTITIDTSAGYTE